MKQLSVLLALSSILLWAGCGGNGSGGNGGGSGTGGPTGNFSNASLSGQYAYVLTGLDLSKNPSATFREAGVFTADGAGHITAGTDDFSSGTNLVLADNVTTGSYSISGDGTGTALLNFASGGSTPIVLTMVSTSKVYLTVGSIGLVENATGAGVAEKQDTTAFTSLPSGTFVFRQHNVSSTQGSSSAVGGFAVATGAITGNQDVLKGGTLTTGAMTGLFNAPDTTTGRGTGNFTDNTSASSNFAYYVVNANTLLLFSTVTGSPGLGRVEKQSGTFSASSLSGVYAFGSNGDTNGGPGMVRTVGQLNANGSGTITAGTFDSVEDGVTTTNAPFTGTYSVNSTGRAAATLTPSSGSGAIDEVFWMVSPSRAFFLVDDSAKVEDGTADLQTGTTFANSTVNGQFGVLMDGLQSGTTVDLIGTLQLDGAGALTLSEFESDNGSGATPPLRSGTYSVASTGRTTASITGISSNFVIYLISGSDGYILQNDADTEIDGVISKQP